MLIGDKEFDLTDNCDDPELLALVVQLSPELNDLINDVAETHYSNLSWLTFEGASWDNDGGMMRFFDGYHLKLFACFDLDAEHVPCNWLIDQQKIRPAQSQ